MKSTVQINYRRERPRRRSSSNLTGLMLGRVAPQHPNLSPDQAAQLPHGALGSACTWQWGVSTQVPPLLDVVTLWGFSPHRAGGLMSPTGCEKVEKLHC